MFVYILEIILGSLFLPDPSIDLLAPLHLDMAANQDKDLENHHDDRPIAIRRKRRISSGLCNLQLGQNTNQEPGQDDVSEDRPRQQPKTPRRQSKRVRFSDSCLDMVESSSSTGLTPALNRTRLLHLESSEKKKPRFSLPTRLGAACPSPTSPSSPKYPTSGEFQFAPLRQVIDQRTARRLRRNNLSEEMNKIHEDRVSKVSLQKEIDELRDELFEVRQIGSEMDENIDSEAQESNRIQELESEIATLKQEMREQSAAIDCCSAEIGYSDIDQDDTPIVRLEDTNNDLIGLENRRSSSPSVAEASTQVSLPAPGWVDILRSARLALEHLFPGEITLELDISDPRPFFETTISRLQSLKEGIMKVEKMMSVNETSTANMGRHLKNVLAQFEHTRNQFQSLSNELAEEKALVQSANLEVETLKAREENLKAKCESAEKECDDHQRSIERLQPTLVHYQNEVKKLTQAFLDLENSHKEALISIRSECSTIQSRELEEQQKNHHQAISDLQANIAAETEGRRKAETSAVNRLDQINELESRQQELKAAINEKQSIIRELGSKIEQFNEARGQEVGQLNVRIGNLVSNLSVADAEVAAMRLEKSRLSKILEDEKAAGLKAISEMQSELSKCAKTVENVGQEHVDGVKKRGEEAQKFQGLLTPIVDGGRFRDAEQGDGQVEGFVQVGRGKGTKSKRPDSGIEIWDDVIFEGPEDDDVVMVEDR